MDEELGLFGLPAGQARDLLFGGDFDEFVKSMNGDPAGQDQPETGPGAHHPPTAQSEGQEAPAGQAQEQSDSEVADDEPVIVDNGDDSSRLDETYIEAGDFQPFQKLDDDEKQHLVVEYIKENPEWFGGVLSEEKNVDVLLKQFPHKVIKHFCQKKNGDMLGQILGNNRSVLARALKSFDDDDDLFYNFLCKHSHVIGKFFEQQKDITVLAEFLSRYPQAIYHVLDEERSIIENFLRDTPDALHVYLDAHPEAYDLYSAIKTHNSGLYVAPNILSVDSDQNTNTDDAVPPLPTLPPASPLFETELNTELSDFFTAQNSNFNMHQVAQPDTTGQAEGAIEHHSALDKAAPASDKGKGKAREQSPTSTIDGDQRSIKTKDRSNDDEDDLFPTSSSHNSDDDNDEDFKPSKGIRQKSAPPPKRKPQKRAKCAVKRAGTARPSAPPKTQQKMPSQAPVQVSDHSDDDNDDDDGFLPESSATAERRARLRAARNPPDHDVARLLQDLARADAQTSNVSQPESQGTSSALQRSSTHGRAAAGSTATGSTPAPGIIPYPAPAHILARDDLEDHGSRGWSLREEDAAIKHMLKVRDENQVHGEKRFAAAAKRLNRETGSNRTEFSFKNFWNRIGRARSGFDERRLQRGALSTSLQGSKNKKTTVTKARKGKNKRTTTKTATKTRQVKQPTRTKSPTPETSEDEGAPTPEAFDDEDYVTPEPPSFSLITVDENTGEHDDNYARESVGNEQDLADIQETVELDQEGVPEEDSTPREQVQPAEYQRSEDVRETSELYDGDRRTQTTNVSNGQDCSHDDAGVSNRSASPKRSSEEAELEENDVDLARSVAIGTRQKKKVKYTF